MINLNEAELMDEENWIETTKMRKNMKKLLGWVRVKKKSKLNIVGRGGVGDNIFVR